MRVESIAAQAGHLNSAQYPGVVMPLDMSTTFVRQHDGEYPHGYIYGRGGNPVRNALEDCVANLEGGDAAIAYASGSAATAAILQTLSPNDHVVAPTDCYHGTQILMKDVFTRWGVSVDFVDFTDPGAVEAAIKDSTKLVWIETPSNPTLQITDVSRIAKITSTTDALLVSDNTWATPILHRPLEFGADVVLHSSTKYLGGHSDVTGGIVVTRDNEPLTEELRNIQNRIGGVPSPFDCWLILRGIRTLHIRMQVHSDNAGSVAEALRKNSGVEVVHYPGLSSHPGHQTARHQMERFGGMLSFQVAGGRSAAFSVLSNLKIITLATSLGGTESLIEHRASIEGKDSKTPDNLLRLSVGLEHVDDLIADLTQALD